MSQDSSSSVLHSSYPLAKKLQLAVVTVACWLATWAAWNSGAPVTRTLLLLVVSTLTAWAWAVTLITRYSADPEGLSVRSIFGLQRFQRKDLETFESLAGEPGQLPRFLLHFSSGHVFLSPKRGCAKPEAMLAYIHANWGSLPVDSNRKPVDSTDQTLVLEYEKLHITVVSLVALAMLFLGSIGPYLGASFLVVLVCARILYFFTQRISTNEVGILVQRPLLPPVHLDWSEIKTVRYWFSPAQGGVVLTDGVQKVRIYRWIGNYPRLVRLLHAKLPQECFPVRANVPWKVPMNERGKLFGIFLGIALGGAIMLVYEGYLLLGLWVAIGSLSSYGLMAASNGRTLHISRDEIRDERHAFLLSSATSYSRAELTDVRLGRQLTAGGLWLKFGNRRLEITNLDSKIAPEEVLRTLAREWHLVSKSSAPARERRTVRPGV